MTGNYVLMTHSVVINLVNFQAWLEMPQAITVPVNHAICYYQKDWNGVSVKRCTRECHSCLQQIARDLTTQRENYVFTQSV